MQFFGKVALSFHIRYNKIMADTGKKKYTAEELSTMDPAVMAGIILSLQDQIKALNTSFEERRAGYVWNYCIHRSRNK